MKTLTITLHSIDNCGSCLQAYCLQQFLLQMDIENQIIDYRPSYGRNNGNALKYFIKKIIFNHKIRKREAIFEEFINNFLILTKERYTTFSELEKESFTADLFLTGSDQVWNSFFPCGRDAAYYLEFVQCGKKGSYAASLGKEIETKEEQIEFSNKVREFDFITVREESSVNMLKKYGLSAKCVCDPTLLFEANFYNKLLKKTVEGSYVLVYLTEKSELLDSLIDYIKKTYQYKIIYVGSFLNRCQCDKNYTDVGPREFLGLVSNAQFVIAGSFHATIFSCIFNREFLILPYKNNERMLNLLKQLNLSEKYVTKFEKDMFEHPIDWSSVNQDIDNFRQESKKNFLQYLKECENE